MNFLVNIKYSQLREKDICDLQDSQEPLLKITKSNNAFKVSRYDISDFEFYLIGDIVFPEDIILDHESQAKYISRHFKQNILYQLKGFYYLIAINIGRNHMIIFSSFLNILPVYYHVFNEGIIVSGTLSGVCENLEKTPKPNEVYIVEKALFNYSFLNNTPFENIFLMPSCHYMSISIDGFSINKYYSIEELMVEKPNPWKKNLKTLTKIFCKELLAYIPEQIFALTLTGGFDGRTVLSSALHRNVEFDAFSYGSINDPDVILPMAMSRTLGFAYTPFYLDDNYAKNYFWKDAVDFLMNSEGAGNISRGHYVLTARELSKTHKFILTGNFGSELIRSMKNPGVMASETLFELFENDNKQAFEEFVHTRKQLEFVHPDLIQKHLPVIIDEVWNYKQKLPKFYTVNKKFYMYMFEEVFRKYFGPEIVVQSQYLINRSPFLDYNVFKATLETSLAGVYQNFRETSPLKRFHGQVLYAHILRALYPQLLDIMLDKGYKPRDFLSLFGRLRILFGYVKRNLFNRNINKSPSYSENLYALNYDKIEPIIEESKYLNKVLFKSMLHNGDWKNNQQEFVNALSMELFFRKCLN
jgi:asparagine synthase (glutamine-hydrolysing)